MAINIPNIDGLPLSWSLIIISLWLSVAGNMLLGWLFLDHRKKLVQLSDNDNTPYLTMLGTVERKLQEISVFNTAIQTKIETLHKTKDPDIIRLERTLSTFSEILGTTLTKIDTYNKSTDSDIIRLERTLSTFSGILDTGLGKIEKGVVNKEIDVKIQEQLREIIELAKIINSTVTTQIKASFEAHSELRDRTLDMSRSLTNISSITQSEHTRAERDISDVLARLSAVAGTLTALIGTQPLMSMNSRSLKRIDSE